MLSHFQLLQSHGQRSLAGYSPWDFPGKNTGMGCHFLLQRIFPTKESNLGLLHCRRILYQLSYKGSPEALKVKSEVAQSCPTLCNPVDCSLPCSSVQGIFQARVLEWVAISFSTGSSPPRDRTQVSCIVSKALYHLSHQGSPEALLVSKI